MNPVRNDKMRGFIFLVIYLVTNILSAQPKVALCSMMFSKMNVHSRNPWVQSMFKLSIEELKQIGYKELGLSEELIKLMVEFKKSNTNMNIAEGANNDGIYLATTTQGILYLKKIKVIHSFDVDTFRQQAAAALVLSQLGLGPKTGIYFSDAQRTSPDGRPSSVSISSHDSPKDAYIIMREGVGVPLPGSKFWKWDNSSPRNREKAQSYIKSRIESDLNKKFSDFDTAYKAWTDALLNHPSLKQKILDASARLEQFGIGGFDVEILLSTQGDGRVTIIDTTSVVPVDINKPEASLGGLLKNFYHSIQSH